MAKRVHKDRYSNNFPVPMPVIRGVRLDTTYEEDIITAPEAIIDSGADISAIPPAVARKIINHVPTTLVAVNGLLRTAIEFEVQVPSHQYTYEKIQFVVYGREEIVLGRNILNQMIIKLYGSRNEKADELWLYAEETD